MKGYQMLIKVPQKPIHMDFSFREKKGDYRFFKNSLLIFSIIYNRLEEGQCWSIYYMPLCTQIHLCPSLLCSLSHVTIFPWLPCPPGIWLAQSVGGTGGSPHKALCRTSLYRYLSDDFLLIRLTIEEEAAQVKRHCCRGTPRARAVRGAGQHRR